LHRACAAAHDPGELSVYQLGERIRDIETEIRLLKPDLNDTEKAMVSEIAQGTFALKQARDYFDMSIQYEDHDAAEQASAFLKDAEVRFKRAEDIFNSRNVPQPFSGFPAADKVREAQNVEKAQKAVADARAEADAKAKNEAKARAEASAKVKAEADARSKAEADAKAFAEAEATEAKEEAIWRQEVEDYAEKLAPDWRAPAKAEALYLGRNFKVWCRDGDPYFYSSQDGCRTGSAVAEFIHSTHLVTLREAIKKGAVRSPDCGPFRK
jgi:hypothetical protein